MSTVLAPLADLPADVAIAASETLAKGFTDYIRHRFTLAADPAGAQTRDILHFGRVAAVLPIDPVRDEIVMLRQFRLAAHLSTGNGELIEIVAGRVEKGEQVSQAASRECQEEIGITPDRLIELFSFLPSPGVSDEEITLFLGIVDASRVAARAGLAAEREDTRPMRVPIGAALAALASGTMHNGPLIMALQWLALNRSRLGEILRTGAVRS